MDDEERSSLLEIPKHGRNDHDRKADPEEHEESAKVSMFAIWIKMRQSCFILNSWKEAPLLFLRSDLTSG